MFVAGSAPSDRTSGLHGVSVDNGRGRPPGDWALPRRPISASTMAASAASLRPLAISSFPNLSGTQ